MIKRWADTIGIDPWDVDLSFLLSFARTTEQAPRSRFRFGSPCRFIRTLDMAVHVILPEMLVEKYPTLACYLRSTSPRWGRSWRRW
jgi:hypothetical protein